MSTPNLIKKRKKEVAIYSNRGYTVQTIRAIGKQMQKLLNRITYYFLNRAYTQLEATGELQNADDVAEFLEDYYAEKVN